MRAEHPRLEIEDLTVEVGEKRLLHRVDLRLDPGEIHVIFGPNGSGKSSLLSAIMGLPPYRAVSGDVRLDGESILGLPPTERARRGIGLAFQHPPDVEGVRLDTMIAAMGAEGDLASRARRLEMVGHLDRDLNVGFSGGERKRSELLQLWMQAPSVVLLDEPESGVDVDSIERVADVARLLFEKDRPIRERRRAGIIVTHTGTILERLHAHRGYVMVDGRIRCAGAPLDIFDQIKRHGFDGCIAEARDEWEEGDRDGVTGST